MFRVFIVLTACSLEHQIHHLSPAKSTPGRAGFAVSSQSTKTGVSTITTRYSSAVAMSPPVPAAFARDVVWRSTTDGNILELCRPRINGVHDCQIVPRGEGAYGGPVVFIENRNLGDFALLVSSYGQSFGVGWVYTHAAEDQPMTPHYGVWVLANRVLSHCRVRDNQPECNVVPMPTTADTSQFVFAGYNAISVHVVRDGNAMKDVLWMRGTAGAQGFLRCEAGGAGLPQCVLAKMM